MRIEKAALKFFREKFPARQIEISDLKKYLKDKGWIEDFTKRDIIRFNSPTHKNIFVFVPLFDEFIDYERCVEIIIEVISSYESRSYEDIYRDLIRRRNME